MECAGFSLRRLSGRGPPQLCPAGSRCWLSGRGTRAEMLRGRRELPSPGIEVVSPAWQDRVATPGPPGKPLRNLIFILRVLVLVLSLKICTFLCLVCSSYLVLSDSLRARGLQPAAFCSWNLPGKNTGVSRHFLLSQAGRF